MATRMCISVSHFVRFEYRRALQRHTRGASVNDNRERTRCLGVGSHAGYVRPHILELAPYKPILPLEVLSGMFTHLAPLGQLKMLQSNLVSKSKRS